MTIAFVDEDFAMRRILTGQAELEPRWKTCLRAGVPMNPKNRCEVW